MKSSHFAHYAYSAFTLLSTAFILIKIITGLENMSLIHCTSIV